MTKLLLRFRGNPCEILRTKSYYWQHARRASLFRAMEIFIKALSY